MEVQSNLKKIQELYKEYKINKKNIDDNWISFFDDLNEEAADLLEGLAGDDYPWETCPVARGGLARRARWPARTEEDPR